VTADEWAIVGILVTLIVGIPAFFAAKKVRSNRQHQHISGGGKGYQAGRDLKIGED
jgi:hypothetical protein